FSSKSPRLPLDPYDRSVRLVPFIFQRFHRRRTQRRIVRVSRRVAMPPHHFFAHHNSHQPLRLRPVPRDFHLVCSHCSSCVCTGAHCNPENAARTPSPFTRTPFVVSNAQQSRLISPSP